MTDKAVVTGCYADFKIIKTRNVCSVSIEIPLEQAQAFVHKFGLPNPAAEIMVAIARLDIPAKQESPPQAKPEPVKAHRAFEELSLPQQAGLMCQDLEFRQFLRNTFFPSVEDSASAANAVRTFCRVNSRSALQPDTYAGHRWETLHNRFLIWKSAQAA